MKILMRSLFIYLFFMIFVTSSNALAEDIKWFSYEEGKTVGKIEKKKIFMNFQADWCAPCKIMKKITFKNSSIINYLNKNYISIRVDVDKEKRVADKYRVSGIPLTMFINEKGEKISNLPGYIQPDKLLPILIFIKTDSFQKMSFSEFLKTYKK